MRIVFNGLQSGIGNNGGSKTILLSAEVIRNLGHICEVATRVDNFTWFKHKNPISYLPQDFDAIINISIVDYEITKNSTIQKKYAWWRGHEFWNADESYLKHCYIDSEVTNFVNSKGMQHLLHNFGASSHVVYQGFDLEYWIDINNRCSNKIRIGCLYNPKPSKRWKDFVSLAKTLGNENYEYVSFGSSIPPDTSFLSKFVLNANVSELVDLYNSCHIFFCPSVSEGLHNVPAESALCGCLLVCNDDQNNGMVLDYAFNNKTAMVYRSGDVKMAAELIRQPNWDLVPKMKEYIRKNIGSRKDNMKKLIDLIKDDNN